MPQRIIKVDAFTDKPFGGNPAAVCVMKEPRDETWMQNVAREMNLSETAFVHPEPSDPGAWRLRWFTPNVEVDLCGHATLATSHVLWTEGHLSEEATARYHTRSGVLKARRSDGWIELDLPGTPVAPSDETAVMVGAVGKPARFAGFSKFDGFVELATERDVREVAPDIAALAAVPVRGVIVTAKAETPGFDFVSRFFAPAVGIDEDPVCGSAHCCLGPYWAEKLGKTDLVAYQASSRGGVLRVGIRGDRVKLAGQAVTTIRGELVGGAG